MRRTQITKALFFLSLMGTLATETACSDGEGAGPTWSMGGVSSLTATTPSGGADAGGMSAGGGAAATTVAGADGTRTRSNGGASTIQDTPKVTGGASTGVMATGDATASTSGGVGAQDTLVIVVGGNFSAGGISSGGATASAGGGTGATDATDRDADSPDAARIEPTPIVLSDDGGWCWFESPRAVIFNNKLVVGSVASGWADPNCRGDIDAVVYDLDSSTTNTVELHDQLELDDHDSAAFLARPDGRLVTLYGKHGGENKFYYRISEPSDALHWGAEQVFSPSASSAVTYSNIYRLTSENDRIYDFFRGFDGNPKPSFAYSDDLGQSWNRGNIVINAEVSSQRPYVRYASNGSDTIHLVYTDGHPRDVNNSLYHIYYRDGLLYRSDGTVVSTLTQGLVLLSEGTLIFRGDADNVARVSDVVLDGNDRPVTTYSVQVGSAGLPAGQGGDDIRYRYARWDGTTWRDHPLAYAGTRLYAAEDDYSGLVVIDPLDPSTVYLSTNANPVTGLPLVSSADNVRHYEIFQARTSDGGQNWTFAPITANSNTDNLRPIVVVGGIKPTRALLWLRGQYRAYTDYKQQIVGLIRTGTNIVDDGE